MVAEVRVRSAMLVSMCIVMDVSMWGGGHRRALEVPQLYNAIGRVHCAGLPRMVQAFGALALEGGFFGGAMATDGKSQLLHHL